MNPPAHDRPDSTLLAEEADAREFETFAQGQDPLDIAAATWVARRRNGLDARGEADLQAWLDADPRHAAAFEDMADLFEHVRQLPDDEVASLKANLPERAPGRAVPLGQAARSPDWQRPIPTRPPVRPANPGQRQRFFGLSRLFPRAAVAAVAFAVMGGGWVGWDHWRQLPAFDRAYATQRGQQLVVSLPDGPTQGSTLHLDTATSLVVRLYRDRREVHLKDGQTLFSVRADADRPFHVQTGGLRITVVGTRFSVRHTHTGLEVDRTVVSVEEGRVRVARVDRPNPRRGWLATDAGINDPSVELAAGQRVVADQAGHIGPVASVPTSAIASWRDGRLSFDQTPLAQAIAEFERYGRTGLVVRDPAVAALPVGGSYSLRNFQRFADALPQVLSVRLVRRGDVTEVVAR